MKSKTGGPRCPTAHVTALDELLEESEEVGDHRIADVHGIADVARLALEHEHRLIVLVAVRSRDTAQYGTAFFGRADAPGNPWKFNSIFVMTGTVKFTGPDNATVNYIINVYPVNAPGLSNADSDGDGFPDPGAQPIVIPGVLPVKGLDHAWRVTLR